MEAWLTSTFNAILAALSLPQYGFGALFIATLLSATLLPFPSEPALYGLVKLQPDWFWPAVLVATVGNTLGGLLNYWMGYGAHAAMEHLKHKEIHSRALRWLEKFGPKTMLLTWLPIVGDPLCLAAGWVKLPFWPCAIYMTIGKLVRFVVYTGALFWAFP